MQIKLKKNIDQTACRTSAFIGGGKWRVLALQLLLVFVAFFSLAGREAQAAAVVSAGFSGDFAAANPTFNINQVPKIEGSCTQQNWQWTRDITAVEIYSGATRLSRSAYGEGGVSWKESYSEDLWFDALRLEPGSTYKAVTSCSAYTAFDTEYASAEKFFSIRPLIGSYTAVMTPDNKLIVEGTVGNGANSAIVFLIDKNGEESLLGRAIGLTTSDFTIESQLAPGKHELAVYVSYANHRVRIGTTIVYPKPTITLDDLPPVTNDPKILLKGAASSAVGIARATFDRHVDMNLFTREEGSFVVPSPAQENVTFEREFNVQDDGTHRFTAWAYGTDNVYVESKVQSILVDRKPPEIKILSHAAGSYIKNNTQLLISATDLAPSGKPGSGVASVQMQATDKDGNASDWLHMKLQPGSADEYSVEIPFDKLVPGQITVEVWAKDSAGNAIYQPKTQYKKSALPTASIIPLASPTRQSEITIKGAAHSDAGLQKISLAWWKDGKTATKQSAVLKFSAGNDANVSHTFTLPDDGQYQFELSVEAQDGQTVKSVPQTVLLDATKPTITIGSPAADSTHEKKLTLEFTVEDAGSGVNDIQIRLGPDDAPWIKDIPINAKGEYSHVLPLDEVDAGKLRVTIWADDKAGNQQWSYSAYIKQVQAAAALDATLTFLNTDGSAANGDFYADQQRLLHVSVKPKMTLKGLNIAYTLPPGLSQRGTPVLSAASSALPQDMPAQLKNWSGSGNLIAGVDLAQAETLIVDIPVAISDATAPNPKLGGMEQTTYFDVTGSNFTDAARAETPWNMQWKQDPADVQRPISKTFDLSAPPDIQIFDAQSGGYDTADLSKWNRNTLHCTSGNATCKIEAGATAVELPFTSASGQSITLKLIGQRHLTPRQGGVIKNTPLQDADNTGADAEARFSLRLPKEELARLPTGGMWKADLNLALQAHDGKALANFRSAITLDVGDTTGMALTPPQIELLPGSHQDHDDSGGYSTGDELTYRISYTAARDLTDVQLDYALPLGLEKAGAAPTFAGNSDMKPDGELSADWNKALLKHGVQMKKGNTLIIDVPLRIQPDSDAHIVSQVFAGAKGYIPMPSTETILQVQRRFSVARALTLTLDIIAPPVSDQSVPALTAATVAQQAPFIYRIVLAAQKQSVENASLIYRLPGGLTLAGAPSLVVDATQKVKLNASWDGDANDKLLDAKTDLAPLQTITIDIPVAVKELVEDGVSVQSTVNASAGNLIDALSAKHTVKVRERQRGGGDQVMVVKSSDAKASVQPGENIVYRIRVSNQTSKIARNLLIRDRAPDHTTLLSSSCGELSPETCKTYLLNDSDIAEEQMTHEALCTTPGRKSAQDGRHVIWCLNGDLEPLDEYVVDYTIQVNGTAPL
ncbi:MAG: hypothetical protein JWQ10_3527 [Herbaspirillum sp.]|nr:hypothetical protein [Herbaspirillum sp.]